MPLFEEIFFCSNDLLPSNVNCKNKESLFFIVYGQGPELETDGYMIVSEYWVMAWFNICRQIIRRESCHMGTSEVFEDCCSDQMTSCNRHGH